MRWKLAMRVLLGTATTTIRAAELGATTTAVIIPGSGESSSALDDLRREVQAVDVRLALLPQDNSGRIDGLRRELEAWRDSARTRLASASHAAPPIASSHSSASIQLERTGL